MLFSEKISCTIVSVLMMVRFNYTANCCSVYPNSLRHKPLETYRVAMVFL
jgi:hypothetical protein